MGAIITYVTGVLYLKTERDAALMMLEQVPGEDRITVGGDNGFDTAEFVDARTTRHQAYVVSHRKRKRIEECFGWLKDIALLRKLKHRGLFRVGWIFTFAAVAYNLVRLRRLIPIPSAA